MVVTLTRQIRLRLWYNDGEERQRLAQEELKYTLESYLSHSPPIGTRMSCAFAGATPTRWGRSAAALAASTWRRHIAWALSPGEKVGDAVCGGGIRCCRAPAGVCCDRGTLAVHGIIAPGSGVGPSGSFGADECITAFSDSTLAGDEAAVGVDD